MTPPPSFILFQFLFVVLSSPGVHLPLCLVMFLLFFLFGFPFFFPYVDLLVAPRTLSQ